MAEKKTADKEQNTKAEKSKKNSNVKTNSANKENAAKKTTAKKENAASASENREKTENKTQTALNSGSAEKAQPLEKLTQSVEEAMSKINKNSQMITAIALILIGILFCAFRTGLLNVMLTIVGAVLIAVGIYELVRKNYVKGGIEIAVGIVIIVCGWVILDIALLLLGLAFIAYAIYAIVSSVPEIKAATGFNKVLAVLNPLVVLIIGILLVAAKWVIGDAICIVIGVIAIIEGCLMLLRQVKN